MKGQQQDKGSTPPDGPKKWCCSLKTTCFRTSQNGSHLPKGVVRLSFKMAGPKACRGRMVMIVPRGRLARCSSRGDALFCLAGRKFAPAKIVRDEPWEVGWDVPEVESQ